MRVRVLSCDAILKRDALAKTGLECCVNGAMSQETDLVDEEEPRS